MHVKFCNSYCILGILILCVCFPAYSQDILWEKSYGGKQADYLFDAIATPDNGYILAGSSLSNKTGNKTEKNQGNLDYWIWKMNQKGELEWQKSFGGPGADLLKSVKSTNDGGYILGGSSESAKGEQKKDANKGQYDYWIVKLNAKGNEEWQMTLGGKGQDELHSISQTSDGGYILGGSSSSGKSSVEEEGKSNLYGKSEAGFGSLDYWVIKLDSKRKIEWQRTLGGQYSDMLRSIQQTRDGGFILGGYSNSPESGNKTERCHGSGDYWIVKLDKDGATEWQKTYGGDKDDQLYAICQTKDGNYVAAGNSNSGSTGNKNVSNQNGTDFWVVKLAEGGEEIWQKTYNVGNVDFLISMIENNDGSLLLGGYAQSEIIGNNKKKENEGINDYVTIKIASDGKELWTQTVGSGGEDILRKVIEIRDGGYLLAGTSNGKPSKDRYTSIGSQDFWVVKLKDKDKKKEKGNMIEAFPNPTQQFTNVVVGYEYEKGTCNIFDLSGRLMQSFAVKDNMIPVDLGALPEGVYIIEIRTNVRNNGIKVIKTINKN